MESASGTGLKTSIPFFDNGVVDWESDPLSGYLLENGKIREAELRQIEKVSVVRTEALGVSLVKYGLLSDNDLAEALEQICELEIAERSRYSTINTLPENLSLRFLKNNHVIPLESDSEQLVVAMAEPRDYDTIQSLVLSLNTKIIPIIGLYSDIQNKIEELANEDSNTGTNNNFSADIKDIDQDDVSRLRDIASEAPVIRTVNNILQRAIELGASDVHLEPGNDGMRVRFRVDGLMRVENEFPLYMSAAISSRIKIMAKMDIAEHRLPQDGRIQIKISGRELDIRVSTIPTLYGESVVIRILDKKAVILDFEQLGFENAILEKLRKSFNKPNGIILVTGPTGSGKTTTLYTGLNSLNSEEKKIITVEDPVEYQLDGINQVAVNQKIGLGFANVLRSMLRQDPDIIMVGEMRDKETASIAIQAALTGHLVLSTLHTNDAISGITRLLDMGIEDYLVTATVTTIVAQRLVRKLCEECKTETDHGFEAKGCKSCNHTGFKGRIAVCELFDVNQNARKIIVNGADFDELKKQAVEDGMVTMYESGMSLVNKGKTTLAEIMRVTDK